MCPLLGTWPATQACALTGNWTGNTLVHSRCSIHQATPARAIFWLNLLGWHWLITLYKFLVCTSIIQYLYIVLCVCYPKSSLHQSPFIPPYTLFYRPLPSFPTDNPIHCLCLWGFLLLLNPFLFVTQPPNTLPSDCCQYVLFSCESVSILFVCLFY